MTKEDLFSKLQILESEKEALKKKNAEKAEEIIREYKKYSKPFFTFPTQIKS